jgi:hypothetical protein
LETGEVGPGYLRYKDCDQGDFLFHLCFEIIRKYTIEELREVHLCVVAEPGKGRSVTKGMAAVKLILDVVSKICSTVLAKAFHSSYSGMKASDHAWRLYQHLFTKEMEDIVFKGEFKLANDTGGSKAKMRYTTYESCYCSSTDYSNATDNFNHEIGREISASWMEFCGIPKYLRLLVKRVSFHPRKVFYRSKDELEDMGKHVEKDLYEITLHRGLLMGDPMTKPILHLLNILVRSSELEVVSLLK